MLESYDKEKIIKDLELKKNRKKDLEKYIAIINNRIDFINYFRENILEKYTEILSKKIEEYKLSVINSISIPFYIFCSRIIKNYN
jgi:hypothetical protein